MCTSRHGKTRVLSGWEVDAAPVVLDVAVLDHGAQEQLARLRGFVFSTCTGLIEQRLNASSKVLTILTAYLVRYYRSCRRSRLRPRSSRAWMNAWSPLASCT